MNPQKNFKFFALLSAVALALVANSSVRAQEAPPKTNLPSSSAGSNDSTNSENTAPIRLSPFEVRASSAVGYGAVSSNSAARVAQNYIDVPQTVNVVTSEFLNDLNIQDTISALLYIPNIELSDTASSTVALRGLPVTATYIDGVASLNTLFAAPLQFYDRIEVVKGPSSAAFGLGEPGGIINYLSKVPVGIDQTTLSVGVGDHSNYRADFDMQNRVKDRENVSYRVIGFWNDGGYYREGLHHKGSGAQLAVRDDINSTTKLQLITNYSVSNAPSTNNFMSIWDNETVYTAFRDAVGSPAAFPELPGTNPYPTSPTTSGTWAGGKILSTKSNVLTDGAHSMDVKLFRTYLVADKSLFDEHLHIRNSIGLENTLFDNHQGQVTGQFNLPLPDGSTEYTTTLDLYHNRGNQNYINENLDLDLEANVRGVNLRSLAGFDYNDAASASVYSHQLATNPDGSTFYQNLYNPDHRERYKEGADTLIGNSASHNRNYGFYVQQEAGFFKDMLTLSAGWRKDFFESKNTDHITGTTTNTPWEHTNGSPRFAATVKPVKWLSVYGLYTTHNDPEKFILKYIQNGPIVPEDSKYDFHELESYKPGGHLAEAGVKASFFDGKLTASLAVFKEVSDSTIINTQIYQQIVPAGLSQILQNLVAGTNANGYEIEVFGQPTRRLTFTANCGLTRGTGPNFPNGKPQFVDPPFTFSAHAKYDFGDLHGNGFYAFVGGKWWGGFWVYQQSGTIYVWYNSGQYVLNGGVGYRWARGRQSVNLNVDNFTNQAVYYGGNLTPFSNAPREQAFITYKVTF